MVSTHSRPKAAGYKTKQPETAATVSTHSRPKAAGPCNRARMAVLSCFNTQPPEGGWINFNERYEAQIPFQHTAARRRLATFCELLTAIRWFQHTAARRRLAQSYASGAKDLGFNTQPPEGGWIAPYRRGIFNITVSTHSRPKAAGISLNCRPLHRFGFNTQPPEGGWSLYNAKHRR